jgi:hypothetical protein
VALEVLRLYQESCVLANGQRVAPRFAAGLEGFHEVPFDDKGTLPECDQSIRWTDDQVR